MPLKYVELLPESLTEDESQCETQKRDYSKKKMREHLKEYLRKNYERGNIVSVRLRR